MLRNLMQRETNPKEETFHVAFHILKQSLTSVLGGIFPKVEEAEDGGNINPDSVFVVGTVILKTWEVGELQWNC